MKSLIVYYSYTGNTESIAEKVHKEIGGDIAEIKTVVSYKGSYNSVVEQGKKEVDQGYMPEIETLSVNLEEYDTIVLGTPVWWYTFAPAVKTFLEKNDFSGKKIYTFATNGGWIGHTFKDIEKICKDASIKDEINIRFDGDKLRTSENEIENWINKIKR